MLGKKIYYALVLVVLLLSIGTVYYHATENWSIVDSFYFSTMTLTTVGFGDLAPTTDQTKIFTSIYALFGIGVMLYILSSVIGIFILSQEKYLEVIGRKTESEINHLKRKITHGKEKIHGKEK